MQVRDPVGVAPHDLGPEGALDLVGRGRRRNLEQRGGIGARLGTGVAPAATCARSAATWRRIAATCDFSVRSLARSCGELRTLFADLVGQFKQPPVAGAAVLAQTVDKARRIEGLRRVGRNGPFGPALATADAHDDLGERQMRPIAAGRAVRGPESDELERVPRRCNEKDGRRAADQQGASRRILGHAEQREAAVAGVCGEVLELVLQVVQTARDLPRVGTVAGIESGEHSGSASAGCDCPAASATHQRAHGSPPASRATCSAASG